MGKAMETMRSTLLWTYGRGTWQYDLICALILAFIFLTPASFFDRKTVPTRQESLTQQSQQADQPDSAAKPKVSGKDQQRSNP